MERILALKRAWEQRWMSLDDVVAVGVGELEDGRAGILVSVRSESAEVRDRLPRSVEGVGVELRVIGDVRAL